MMASWGFLTNHARVLLCVAHDPGMRLRDIAARLDITERSAHGIITDLTAAGYLVKQKDGRRNRYQIQAHLPLPEPASRDRTVGEVLALLTGNDRPGIELPPASDANGRRATQAGLETPPMPGRQADGAGSAACARRLRPEAARVRLQIRTIGWLAGNAPALLEWWCPGTEGSEGRGRAVREGGPGREAADELPPRRRADPDLLQRAAGRQAVRSGQ